MYLEAPVPDIRNDVSLYDARRSLHSAILDSRWRRENQGYEEERTEVSDQHGCLCKEGNGFADVDRLLRPYRSHVQVSLMTHTVPETKVLNDMEQEDK